MRQRDPNQSEQSASSTGRANSADESTSRRVTAWAAFERGDFAAAADEFLSLAAVIALAETDLRGLIETSLAVGRARDAVAALLAWLDAAEPDVVVRLRWAAEGFTLARAHEMAPEAETLGLAVLESAAALDDEAIWLELAGGNIRAIETAMPNPPAQLAAYEQESFAPESTGLPTMAAQRIEEIGHQHAADYAVARAAERLLHASGNRAAAYRVEHARRAAAASAAPDEPPPVPELRLAGWKVAVAGGHAKLRSRLGSDLRSAGAAELREIPSSKEASLLTRDVQAVLAGADVVVVITRQIAHSTFAQVRPAAARAGVPLISAQTASTAGVRRALEHWLAGQPGIGSTLDEAG